MVKDDPNRIAKDEHSLLDKSSVMWEILVTYCHLEKVELQHINVEGSLPSGDPKITCSICMP